MNTISTRLIFLNLNAFWSISITAALCKKEDISYNSDG